jgi:hypothetical protein
MKINNTPTLILPCRRLCRNHEITRDVILNAVKNLDRLTGCIRRDPSASPQDDIKTQSLEGKETGAENWLSLGESVGTLHRFEG